MRIAITGHRPNKLDNDYNFDKSLSKIIIRELQKLIDTHRPTEIISGMALGIDTIWAILALKNGIKLTAALPCLQQESKWSESSRKLYHRIINDPLCTKHYVSEEIFTPYCMQERNKWMVDNCDLLIAVWDGTPGGTSHCFKYATKEGRDIVLIDPNDLRGLPEYKKQ